MFNVPVEKHGRNAHLRQRGKVAVLALGYGGGVSALEAMGGSRLGLTEEEMRSTVRQWRGANPRIVRLWERVQNAAVNAILNENRQPINRGIVMECHGGMLTVKLPSGRYLCYPEASLEEENGKTDICYMGVNQTTRKWEKVRTYGGQMTENLVQAITRDILGWIILRADRAGMPIVFHIHDEIVVDAPPSITLQEVEAIFSKPISWCPDLPLKGAGYSTPYYLKD
jgi:DNA polymerase